MQILFTVMDSTHPNASKLVIKYQKTYEKFVISWPVISYSTKPNHQIISDFTTTLA